MSESLTQEQEYQWRAAVQCWIHEKDIVACMLDVLKQREFLEGAFIRTYQDDLTKGTITAAHKGGRTLVLDIETNGL